jgi:hypothetical protein
MRTSLVSLDLLSMIVVSRYSSENIQYLSHPPSRLYLMFENSHHGQRLEVYDEN